MKKLLTLSTILVLFSAFIKTDSSALLIIKHQWYTTWFDPVSKVPVMTVYFYTKRNRDKLVERTPFTKDRQVSSSAQGSDDDYSAPYDRGHLVPARDMQFSTDAMEDVMVYTNIAPQWNSLNRGPWKEVENYVRELSVEYDSLWIATGCLIDKNDPNKVKRPTHFWKSIKIVLKGMEMNTVTFIFKNQIPNSNNIKNYLTSLDSIQRVTGLIPFSSQYSKNKIYVQTQSDRENEKNTTIKRKKK